jgi:hypothetical protein
VETDDEIDELRIIEIVELAKAIDVAESDLRSDSERKSPKKRGRQSKSGSNSRAAKKTNISKTTIHDAQAHIAAIDAYPEIKAIVRGANDRATIGKNLDKLPEDERAEALDALVKGDQGLAKAIDVAETDLVAHCATKSDVPVIKEKKKRGRQKQKGSRKRAATKTNIPLSTVRKAEAHIAAIDTYPEIKAIVRGANDRATIGKNLDKLPEDERAEALDALVKGDQGLAKAIDVAESELVSESDTNSTKKPANRPSLVGRLRLMSMR